MTKKEMINSLEDIKGLKIRIPGFAGEIFAKLGCAVTNIAPGELYTALSRGTIDALEWVGPGMDISMGFHKIAPYYYTGWHEPATELQFVVNRTQFDKLSARNKEILRVAMRTAAYDMLIQNYDMSATAWDKIKTEYPNIKIKSFPNNVIDLFLFFLIIASSKGIPCTYILLYKVVYPIPTSFAIAFRTFGSPLWINILLKYSSFNLELYFWTISKFVLFKNKSLFISCNE